LIKLADFEEGDNELLKIKEKRTAVEYYWTCTPSLPLYIFDADSDIDVVTYLDADLYFFSDPILLYEYFNDHSILIIEHRYAPQHHHIQKIRGIYNVGALLFRRDENGLECLNWWRSRCIEWCYNKAQDNKFGDQKYLDDWPARFNGVLVLDHKGANLAPWNISQYYLSLKDGNLFADEDMVIFYHFHAFKVINSKLIEPTREHSPYGFSPFDIQHIYYSYSDEILVNLRWLGQTPEYVDALSYREVSKRLFSMEWYLVSPKCLRMVILNFVIWVKKQDELIASGLVAYNRGETKKSRLDIIKGVAGNPILLFRRNIASTLLGSCIGGKSRVRKYKQYLRRFIE
jgi:hypothetical protein